MLTGLVGDESRTSFSLLFLSIVATVAVCILSIDLQSYWMDELGTWQYAGADGLNAWFNGFLKVANSDGQLPLYHFLVFLWSRVVGLSEWALRSLNGAFLMMAIISVAWRSGLPRIITVWWIALLLSSCFVWAYLNEARPYIMLLAGSALLTLSLCRATQGSEANKPIDMGPIVALFFTGSLLSFGASPIAAPVIGLSLLAILWTIGAANWPNIARIDRRHMLWCGFCLLAAIAVAALVLYSISKGATPEQRNSTSIATTLFGVLEVMGGGGFVPGRDVLRAQGLHAIQSWQWAILVMLALAWAVAIVKALCSSQRQLVLLLLVITVLSMLCVVSAGFVIGFRVIGRHFAFAVPPLLLVLAIGIGDFGVRARWIGALLCVLLLFSTALFRLDGGHRKDDTAGAAAILKRAEAQERRSWWVGGYLIPLYFKIPTRTLATNVAPGGIPLKAGDGENWGDAMPHLIVPDLIVIERPEVNDPQGMFATYAERSGLKKRRLLRGYVAYSR